MGLIGKIANPFARLYHIFHTIYGQPQCAFKKTSTNSSVPSSWGNRFRASARLQFNAEHFESSFCIVGKKGNSRNRPLIAQKRGNLAPLMSWVSVCLPSKRAVKEICSPVAIFQSVATVGWIPLFQSAPTCFLLTPVCSAMLSRLSFFSFRICLRFSEILLLIASMCFLLGFEPTAIEGQWRKCVRYDAFLLLLYHLHLSLSIHFDRFYE